MKNYYYHATKLDRGYVMVRDYNLNECNNSKSDLIIVYNEREMKIPHSELKQKAIKLDEKIYQSQFDKSKTYKIYHFKWVPELSTLPPPLPTLFDKVDIK